MPNQMRFWLLLLAVLLGLSPLLAQAKDKALQRQQALAKLDNQLLVKPVWSSRTGIGYGKRYLKLQPVSDGETVFGADWRGELYAFDQQTGEQRWHTETGSEITGGLVLHDDLLLLGAGDGSVQAFDKQGVLVWKRQLSSEVVSKPAVAGEVVVVHVNDGNVAGLNLQTGEQLWNYYYKVPVLTLRGASTPAISDEHVAIVGLATGKLIALDSRNGTLLWQQSIAVPQGRSELQRMVDIDADPLVMRGTVYSVAYQGRIAAVDVASGRTLWTRELSSYSGISADNGNLYVTDAEGNLLALDRFSGASLWRQEKLQGLGLTRPLIYRDKLILSSNDGFLYWASKQDGKLVSRAAVKDIAARLKGLEWDLWEDYNRGGLPDFYDEDIGINVSPVALDDDTLVIADNQGHITVFSAQPNM